MAAVCRPTSSTVMRVYGPRQMILDARSIKRWNLVQAVPSKVSLVLGGGVETVLVVNYGEDGSQDFCNRNVYWLKLNYSNILWPPLSMTTQFEARSESASATGIWRASIINGLRIVGHLITWWWGVFLHFLYRFDYTFTAHGSSTWESSLNGRTIPLMESRW